MNTKSDNKLTVGIMLGAVPPWTRIVEHARLVETLGFDKLWVPDSDNVFRVDFRRFIPLDV